MSACLFVFCLLVTHVYSLYASGCLLSSLFLIYLLWVYLSKKKKIVHTKERKLDAFLYLMMLFCVSGVGYMHLKGELSRDKL